MDPNNLELIEDESGKWIHPRFMVVNSANGKVIAEFDSEQEAADWLDDLIMELEYPKGNHG